MGESDEFNTLTFEKKLMQLKDTQESIQSLSSWCLKQRQHHKKIVSSWLNVLKRVKVDQRLVLFYLANDVIQYSKRKNLEFVESWGLNLQKATPLVREDKVRQKILRIFKIWEQRSVYDDEFLSDLTGLLSAGATKKTDDDPLDFQPQQLVNKIKQCSVLEADTDLRLKQIHENPLQLNDAEELCTDLKDRINRDDVEKELNEGISCVERYTQALQREIVARESLLALLASANQYYSTQRGEVKVVSKAYKTFGTRVKALKRKLDELIPTLRDAPSPPPCEQDVPSPGPDEDLELPGSGDNELAYNIDKTFNSTFSVDGSMYNLGISSFLGSDSAMSLFNDSSNHNDNNKIEVIGSRPSEKEDFDINHFIKNFTPTNDNNATALDNISVASGTLSQKSQDTLPGLDLLTPESTGNIPPPSAFYTELTEDAEHPFSERTNSPWSNSNPPQPVAPPTWTLPPAPVPPPTLQYAEPPASPPPSARAPHRDAYNLHQHQVNEMPPPADVDHRGLLPPPPPPPILPMLGQLEDVDHRMLPSVPPPPIQSPAANIRLSGPSQDVDHRNLISLTHQRPPPSTAERGLDQDYRVPPLVPPPDIVESVDMDLSEDDESSHSGNHGVYSEEHRRNFSQNNKVLVGGHNGKLPLPPNFSRTNSLPEENYREKPQPLTAPPLPTFNNPFEIPPNLKYTENERDVEHEIEEELRQERSPDEEYFQEWPRPPGPNSRFQSPRFRNWSPNSRPFRPFQQGFRPRGPRTPNRPWLGARPRFW